KRIQFACLQRTAGGTGFVVNLEVLMRSLFMDLFASFSYIYSGWIFWNLFLAFIPLILSFVLFRRAHISKTWLWVCCAFIGFIGVIGFLPRAYYLAPSWTRLMQAVIAGDRSSLLRLGWLILLAAICLGLSFSIFRRKQSARSWLWWVGFVVFVAFLPNAPYLLTDIIHLIRGTSSGLISTWVVALVFIPIHVSAILLGFEAYVISLINQGAYLKSRNMQAFILPTELLMHGLNAVGIYLGRFIRFNSWDLATEPTSVLITTLNALTARRPLIVIGVTFIILTVFYWIMKQVTLGLKLRIDYARQGLDVIEG
ncbi:MAG: DUF1361 domain-containing protein, partial [Cyanobacteria bacterium J06626_14]